MCAQGVAMGKFTGGVVRGEARGYGDLPDGIRHACILLDHANPHTCHLHTFSNV